jgi:hypothetical protein
MPTFQLVKNKSGAAPVRFGDANGIVGSPTVKPGRTYLRAGPNEKELRSVVHDYPSTYAIGFRDVVAAWLVCLVIAATGIASAAIVAVAEDSIVEACAGSHTPGQHHPSRSAPPPSLRS